MSHERTIPKRKDCLPIIMFRGELFVCLVWLISSYVCPAECSEFSNFFGGEIEILNYEICNSRNTERFSPIFERRYISGIYESMSNTGVSTFPGSTQAWGSTYHPPTPRKGHVERQLVVEQLRSGGVIEALQVQRAGFPCRCTVSIFVGGFGWLKDGWITSQS